jgi:hypothetical protein
VQQDQAIGEQFPAGPVGREQVAFRHARVSVSACQ